MRTFIAKSMIVFVSGLFATAAFAQSLEQQVALCMTGDPTLLDQKIAGCTALISSGRLSEENLAAAFNSRGNAYDDKMDYSQAIADYNEALRYDPQSSMAFFNRGQSFSRQQNHDRAIADYSEAIRLKPQYAKAYYGRGISERRLGKSAESAADIARACAIDPGYC